MQRSRSLADVHTQLADEHRRIMRLAAYIEQGPAHDELPELLKTLHDLLVDHFAHEQFPGGLYECLGAWDPRYHDQLRVLVREHCEVLSRARALVERARLAPDAPSLRGEALDLVAALREHETREHRLVEAIRQAQDA